MAIRKPLVLTETGLSELPSADTMVMPSHSHTTADLTDFPSQSGNNGKVLSTNGSTLSWSATSGASATILFASVYG